MLFDGIKLVEGSEFQNLVVALGSAFPDLPSEGELFYRNDGANEALYVYNGGAWIRQLGQGDSFVDLLPNSMTPGTYKSVTVSAKGLVTAASNPANPTTLAGYGITDAQPLDADLTAISAISATSGLLRKTAADTWNLDTSTYLTSNQSISISGDASGSGSNAISLTLANTGVGAGSYGNATSVPTILVDAKGRVVTASNTAIALDASAITSGAFTNARISQSSVTQHQTTLVVTEAQITDGSILARVASPESITGAWTFLSTLTGSLSGNATTATSLQTSRNFSIGGDVSAPAIGFDGSGAVSLSTTLATVNAAPQTDALRKITVNAKGLTTATSAVTASDLTSTLGYTPVNKAGDTMTGLLVLSADPSAALGAVTKQYVDNIAAGLTVHVACETATMAPLPSCTYNNGASGVGATLTATANGALGAIGGYSLFDTSGRCLVKNQADAAQNGIYVVTNKGSASTPWSMIRAADFDNTPQGEIATGGFTYIEEGTLVGTQWAMTTYGTITPGTTPINFTQLTGAGVITAGAGIAVASNVVSNTGVLSNVAGTGISVSGATGNVTIANTGVTSLVAGSNISISGSTGAVTISATGTVPSATAATNLAGGVAGNLAYQSSANTTAMLGTGTSSQVLVSGATPSWTTSPNIVGTNFTGIPNGALNYSSLTLGTTSLALGSTTTVVAGLTSVTSATFIGSLTGNATNITGTYAGTISSAQITVGLGFTPYNSTNPNSYTSNLGTVTGVTATAPVVSTGTTAPVISMPAATTTVDGYLTHTDWNTFNGKQALLGFTPYNSTNPSGYISSVNWVAPGTIGSTTPNTGAFTTLDVSGNSTVIGTASSRGGRNIVINPTTPLDGDMQVVGAVISVYASGAWRQIFPAVYS